MKCFLASRGAGSPAALLHHMSSTFPQALVQHACYSLQVPSHRELSSQSEQASTSDSIMSALGIKMYPDLADANEREEAKLVCLVKKRLSGFAARSIHQHQLAKSFSSLGRVLSLYRKPRTRAEHGLLPFCEDWSYYFWNRFDTQRICKQSILGFSRTSFLDHACAAFQLVHAATSSGSPQLIEQLKEVAVPRLYEQLKADARRLQQHHKHVAPRGRHKAKGGLEASHLSQPQWELVRIVSAEVVDAADACPLPAEVLKTVATKLHCAQLTVRFVSEQRKAKGTEVFTFEDFWVFERPLYKSWIFRKAGPWGAKWRLLAPLEVQEMTLAMTASEREQATAAARERIEKFGMGVLGFGIFNLVGYGLYSVFFT